MKPNYSRRDFLGAMGMAAGAYMATPAQAPASRVAIGVCPEYNRQVSDVLAAMFDQLGGLAPLVRGKTVAIKLNMTGPPATSFGTMKPNHSLLLRMANCHRDISDRAFQFSAASRAGMECRQSERRREEFLSS